MYAGPALAHALQAGQCCADMSYMHLQALQSCSGPALDKLAPDWLPLLLGFAAALRAGLPHSTPADEEHAPEAEDGREAADGAVDGAASWRVGNKCVLAHVCCVMAAAHNVAAGVTRIMASATTSAGAMLLL